ncbi:MAG: hypothetical protein JNM88_14325 [Chitinophagaceae bacterium]|nr:hypothetical protein [Chitinophagaceae bacterium]
MKTGFAKRLRTFTYRFFIQLCHDKTIEERTITLYTEQRSNRNNNRNERINQEDLLMKGTKEKRGMLTETERSTVSQTISGNTSCLMHFRNVRNCGNSICVPY